MFRMIAVIAAAFTLGMAPQARAQFYAEGASPESVGALAPALVDGATGLCWTNLRETRALLVERLQEKGYRISSSDDGAYQFSVEVTAFRESACTGVIRVRVFKVATLDGTPGLHVIGGHERLAINPENLNGPTLDIVEELISKM